ncbi:PREDICTED: uncharacterized protein LOC104704060 [Camelina sativa]|uniref:Uncharacterized protein LOC104704060 n=1 Tax=Camelina sativa TaxID=90675 RepID=A0ABM0SZQ5_CAMSA|nr:PREDICTED: uncharacterized protein LOC104704060 [Camelina sativa]
MDKLDEFRTGTVTYVVMPLQKGAFKVTEPLHKDGWIVLLSECTCTCGKFQSKKFPCLHALAVCTFAPVPDVSAWPEASGIPTLFPPVMSLPPPPTSPRTIQKKKS